MARFMLFMYPGISDEEYAEGPSLEDVQAMNRYNEELTQGRRAAGGRRAARREARARLGASGVTDGPFSEAKELVGGYWIIQAKDREEAVEWAKRVPPDGRLFVEVRQISEMADFSEDIQDAAELSRASRREQTIGVTAAGGDTARDRGGLADRVRRA